MASFPFPPILFQTLVPWRKSPQTKSRPAACLCSVRGLEDVSPSSAFRSCSEQGARPAWRGQRGPPPMLPLGACQQGGRLICCHHFVSLVLSGSRKLGGHSGSRPPGSCRARGGRVPEGVGGELHAHRLWHRYPPPPGLPCFTVAFWGGWARAPAQGAGRPGAAPAALSRSARGRRCHMPGACAAPTLFFVEAVSAHSSPSEK